MTTYTIALGDGKVVSMRQYVAMLKIAKAHPADTFRRGLDCWPATGREIMREFYRSMVTDHCNRGLTIYKSHDTNVYLARRLKRGKLVRSCKWCGQTFTPAHVNDEFDDADCRRCYYGG